jgi:DNA mismatch repair protein MutS
MTTEEKSTNGIMNEYLELTQEYTQKYGQKTIVLMQVGSFYEVYGLRDPVSGDITGSQIMEYSQICQLNVAEKKLVYKSKQILMAGFPQYTLEKYLEQLNEAGYTAVVIKQEKTGKTTKRVLDYISSSGTFVSYETDASPKMSNNVLSIWIDLYTTRQKTQNMVCGLSVINTFTGKSALFEYETPFAMNPTTFDEMERFVSIHSPMEVLFISPFDQEKNRQILQYSGVRCQTVHHINSVTNEKAMNCAKQTYIKHILTTHFGEDAYEVCSEFYTNATATQSFCYLLNFVKEHNMSLIRAISIPEFMNTGDRMVLANHTLKQLNMIEEENAKSENAGKLSSVSRFLNYCCTAMGKRLFQYQLLTPVFNAEWINQEYAGMEHLLSDENSHFIEFFRKQLSQVRDMEKIVRQIVMKKVYPSSISHLYKSVKTVGQIQTCLSENPEINRYLLENSNKVLQPSDDFVDFLDQRMNMEKSAFQNSATNLDIDIIRPGVSEELDRTREIYTKRLSQIAEIKDRLQQIIRKENPGAKPDIEYIKINETEKAGITLQITKTRGELLKKAIGKLGNQRMVLAADETDVTIADIKIVLSTGTTCDIKFPLLNEICSEVLSSKERISILTNAAYQDILSQIESRWLNYLADLSKYTARLDVLQSKCYVAQKYRYCKPRIDENNSNHEKSYASAKGIRHCLIERLLQNELYEKNDITIGKDNTDGILLYGTNAVGKTSIIRALGICIIMAQAGMYVPCDEFVYSPYRSIYTRILGNDNLFKGLSTFAVEMSELRTILNMVTNQSLILGDELCSGTETESALSIFVAGVMDLSAKSASFMFATHFHEIVDFDEIKSLQNIRIKHMSVIYDRERDCLIYDRKLRDGQGLKTYGLEVCKSLYLPQEFLETAYGIRNKYYPDTRGGASARTSHYNAKKIMDMCEVCKTEIAGEVHHLQPQKDADNKGYIGTIHKNAPANLAAVCEACHDKFHSGEATMSKRKTKTTRGYIIT